jgi:hypothetical protein
LVFATGGFLANNEKMRYINTTSQFYIQPTTGTNSTATGALRVAGGVGIGGGLFVGGIITASNVLINGSQVVTVASLGSYGVSSLNGLTGTLTISVGTDTAISTSSNSILIWNTGTLQSVTSRGATTNNAITVNNNLTVTGQGIFNGLTATVFTATSASISGTISATGQATLGSLTATITTVTQLTVSGGLSVGGSSILANLTATNFTATVSTILGTQTVNGVLTAAANVISNATNNGSIVVTGNGGIGVGGSIVAGGTLTVGTLNSGTTVNSIYSNNTLISNYTSNFITGTGQATLDTYSATLYRTAEYLVQVVDGANIHVEKLMVTHDGTNSYLTEYAVIASSVELGTFTATLSGGIMTLYFTPTGATQMTIKVVRTTITL